MRHDIEQGRGGEPARGRASKRRIALWSVAGILALAFALPLAGYALHGLGPIGLGGEAAAQQSAEGRGAELGPNPRSNYWRAVSEGVEGYSAVTAPGANVLIERGGTGWQEFRNGPVRTILPWAILAMAGVLLLYHLVFGRNTLDGKPLSGRKVPRWGWFDRTVHWTTALSFIVLAVTGLSVLVGRVLLIPLLGKAGFATWAQVSVTLHNVVGPVFTLGITLMLVMWMRHNLPTKVDWTWLKMGGGMFSKSVHPPAGRMNAGEKLWFWLVASVGVLVCLTGIVLVAPVYGLHLPFLDGLRPEMRGANIVHSALATLWTAAALGHVYIGTAGTEGAFEAMATGHVSEEWAKQHHDLWYEDMARDGRIVSAEEAAADPSRATPDRASVGAEPATT